MRDTGQYSCLHIACAQCSHVVFRLLIEDLLVARLLLPATGCTRRAAATIAGRVHTLTARRKTIQTGHDENGAEMQHQSAMQFTQLLPGGLCGGRAGRACIESDSCSWRAVTRAVAAVKVRVRGAQGSTCTPLSLKRPGRAVSSATPAATALALTLKLTCESMQLESYVHDGVRITPHPHSEGQGWLTTGNGCSMPPLSAGKNVTAACRLMTLPLAKCCITYEGNLTT